MKVYVSTTKEAGGMGGALLAKYAWWQAQNGGEGSFEEMEGGQVIGLQCVAQPRKAASDVFEALIGTYTICEERVAARL